MVATISVMPARIYPRRPARLFLAEWRERKELTQEQLGRRLDPAVSDVTVSRWETGKRRPDLNVLAALAEAMNVPLQALFRHPDQPSADDLLRGQPPEIQSQALRLIKALTG